MFSIPIEPVPRMVVLSFGAVLAAAILLILLVGILNVLTSLPGIIAIEVRGLIACPSAEIVPNGRWEMERMTPTMRGRISLFDAYRLWNFS
jgi:hypothetical protein